MSFPAKKPSGLLNVEPALASSSGCFSSRRCVKSSMRARMSSGSSSRRENVAESTTSPSSFTRLWR